MKLADIDKVNHLVNELADVKALIAMADKAEAESFQLFIEAVGDASVKMSAEGASTSHSRGIDATPAFLEKLKTLAITELHDKRGRIVADLAALGVEAEE